MWLVLVLLPGAGTVMAVAAVRCYGALRKLRRAERLAAGRAFDLESIELAFLAGKVGDLTVAQMYEGGRLVAARSGDVMLTTPAAAGTGAATGDGAGDGFEAVVVRSLRSARTGDLKTLFRAVDRSPEAKALRARLAARGLADDEELVERLWRVNRRTPALGGAAVAMSLATVAWTSPHRGLWPVPLAVFLLSLVAVLWINRVSCPSLRTATGPGERVLEAAQAAEPRRHGTAAVALWGLSALHADHDLRTCDAASGARSLEAAMRERLHECSGGHGCGE
ncbi:hypothetical protein [Kitasatospora sp. NPDC054795]